MKLTVIVPSYGRPQAAFELLDAVERTATLEDTKFVFVVDESDTLKDEYPADSLVSPTRGMIPALNYGAYVAAMHAHVVCFMGDDHRPRTEGWDSHYCDAIHEMGGTGMVYGNDLLQGARIPTQIGISADIIRTLGWMAPPTFKHLFVDDAWLAIGKAINRIKYLPNTIVEHLHPLAGKAEMDENYERVNSVEIASHDQLEFQRWKSQDLRNIARSLSVLL